MTPQLSIICPAIRVDRWEAMYKSIEESFSGSWELVLITEKELPESLKSKTNIKVIFSERSPMGKQQQGLLETSGEYITVMSDDSVWHKGTLDKTFELLKTITDYKMIVVLKYLEGKEFEFPQWYIDQVPDDMKFKTNYDFMKSDKYYLSDTHDSSKFKWEKRRCPILSCAVYTRKLLIEIGGWDAQFQSQAMGNTDLAIRLMKYGCPYIIQDLIVSSCGYMEVDTGDHGPIHDAQTKHDQDFFMGLYQRQGGNRIIIPFDNHKNQPDRWERRFGG